MNARTTLVFPALGATHAALPLSTPDAIMQAAKLCALQAPLREAERSPAETPTVASLRMSAWLIDRTQVALAALRGCTSWSDIERAGTLAPIDRQDSLHRHVAEATLQPEELLRLAELQLLYGLRDLCVMEADSAADAAEHPAVHIRAILAALHAGGRTGTEFVWPIGASRPPAHDAVVVYREDARVSNELRDQIDGALFVLLTHVDTPKAENSATTHDPRVLCDLEDGTGRAPALGMLATLRDLVFLYGHAIAQDEERLAVAKVFAQVVQQQQAVAVVLEKAGLRIDPRRANAIPEDCLPEIAFRLATHEVLREEIDQIQQAKAEGTLVSYALRARRRLAEAIRSTAASRPDVPLPSCGWMPSEKQARQPLERAVSFIVAHVRRHGEAVPVLAAINVAALKDKHAQHASEPAAA